MDDFTCEETEDGIHEKITISQYFVNVTSFCAITALSIRSTVSCRSVLTHYSFNKGFDLISYLELRGAGSIQGAGKFT